MFNALPIAIGINVQLLTSYENQFLISKNISKEIFSTHHPIVQSLPKDRVNTLYSLENLSMMGNKKAESAGAENPERFTGLKLRPIKKSAAGIPAVLSGLRHVLGEAGLIRGWKALKKLNQKDGFDCPSCAWPDPDDERNGSTEYCENGAKAIAEEATAKKLEADFFAKHSVNELAALSDYEIGKKGRIARPMYLSKDCAYYQYISWDDAFQKM